MKRTLLIFFILFIAMQLIQTEQTNVAINKSKEIQAPDNIMTLLKESCYDCHSNEVNWPWYSSIAPFSWVISEHVNSGRKWLNFSVWEDYTKEEKKKKMKGGGRMMYGHGGEVMPKAKPC